MTSQKSSLVDFDFICTFALYTVEKAYELRYILFQHII